jgi:hypothetical protein
VAPISSGIWVTGLWSSDSGPEGPVGKMGVGGEDGDYEGLGLGIGGVAGGG